MALKEFNCRDVGMDDDFKIEGDTEEEILLKAEQHGREKHGMKEFTEDLKTKVRSAIKDVSEPREKVAS